MGWCATLLMGVWSREGGGCMVTTNQRTPTQLPLIVRPNNQNHSPPKYALGAVHTVDADPHVLICTSIYRSHLGSNFECIRMDMGPHSELLS